MNPVTPQSIAWVQGAGGLVAMANNGDTDLPWDSAITRLITGINKEFGEERYRLLRQRIHTTALLSEWDRNLVKVCAKRVSSDPRPPADGGRVIDVGRNLEPDLLSDRTAKWRGVQGTPEKIIDWLDNLIAEEMMARQDRELHQSPRPVAAALFDASGTLICANINTNAGMQLRHAEVNLLLAMKSRGILRIPDGAILYVSLKPCRMCASLLNTLTASLSPLRVIAVKDDPGPHGRHSMLPGLKLIDDDND